MGRNLPKTITKAPTTTSTSTATSGMTSDYTSFLKSIAQNPQMITGYSKILKSAGYYKGKVTSKYTPALQAAFNAAEAARASISAVSPMTRDEFLKQQVLMNAGNGGTTPITKYQDVKVSSTTDIKALIESIIQDKLGRKATIAEISKYTSAVQKAQEAAPIITSYETVGSLRKSKTTGGINEQQYLVDKVAGTDEAKANKVLGFYQTFMNALGGNR